MEARVDKALQMLENIFQGKQASWPDNLHIVIKVGQIKDIISVLGGKLIYDENNVGARKKDA